MVQHWKKSFLIIWAGQAISTLTSSVLQFAIVWYINAVTQSAFALSMAMLVGFLPRALLGPFIGVFIDRYDRKKIMIYSDLFIAAVSLIPIISTLLLGRIPLASIYVILFLRSIGTAFHMPSLQAVTPQIVPMDQLVRCEGFSQGVESVSEILSPAIAAVLFARLSLGQIIWFDIFGAIIAVILLGFVEIPQREVSKEKLSAVHVVREAKEGFQILKAKKGLLGLTVVRSFYSLALMPVGALFPLMATAYFGGTEKQSGQVETVFALGLLVGAIVLARTGGIKNKVLSIAVSCLLMSASLSLSGFLLPTQFALFMVAAFFMGFSNPFFIGAYRPLLQQNFEDKYIGRVMSLTNSITVIASPIGMLVSGLFSEIYGAEKWFRVAGMMTLLCAVACVAVKDIRTAGSPVKKGELINGSSL